MFVLTGRIEECLFVVLCNIYCKIKNNILFLRRERERRNLEICVVFRSSYFFVYKRFSFDFVVCVIKYIIRKFIVESQRGLCLYVNK